MKKRKVIKNINHQVSVKEEPLEFDGLIEEALPGTKFVVLCDNGHKLIASIGGRLRMNNIRLTPGDRVKVEVSVYDLKNGRITWRN